MAMKGIDVAKWQGIINWSKVKASGIAFAILKATRKDNQIEDSFETNYNGCLYQEIPVGVYRYVYAKTYSEACAEAKALVSVLSGKKITCGVWLDMEDKSIRNIGGPMLQTIIDTENQILVSAGYKVGIYCNRDWYNNVLPVALRAKYPFWIARYPAIDTGIIKDKLSPVDYAQAWQYSSKGKVPGISGNVDMDICYSNITELMASKSSFTPLDAKPVLQDGSRGIYVVMLQTGLAGAHLYHGDLDGIFGQNTKAAVIAWQGMRGITKSGVCDQQTWESFKI